MKATKASVNATGHRVLTSLMPQEGRPCRRKAAWNVAHHLDAQRFEPHAPRHRDAAQHDHQRAGQLGNPRFQHPEDANGPKAHAKRESVGGRRRIHEVAQQQVHLVAPFARDPTQMGQLVQPNQEGCGGGEPADDGFGQEVDHEPHAQHAHAPLHEAHHDGEQQRQFNVPIRPRQGQSAKPRSHQQAVHGHRSHRQVPRGAEEPVDNLRNQRRVKAIHHRKSSNHRVGHALGDEHDAHRQSGRPISFPLRFGIGAQPS